MDVVTRCTAILAAATVALLGAWPQVRAETSAPWPTAGWVSSTPEEQGMDAALLAQGIEYLGRQDRHDVHSATVIRNGTIVVDAYFAPFAEGGRHSLASVTKSFLATIVGIAIDRGHIDGVDQPVLEWFPEKHIAYLDADKQAMTIEDLLTMSAGIECEGDLDNIVVRQMLDSPDWVQFALDRPMADPPGTHWAYCNPASHLLSEIVTRATGMSTSEFAREHLFEPMGITESIWPSDPQGTDYGFGELIMAPHDMAKLGYLYLQDGVWDGQRLVSSAWIDAATAPGLVDHYGYQWWRGPDWYCAFGFGGQRVCVYPDEELIVAMTGGGGDAVEPVGDNFIDFYVQRAVVSDTRLPPNTVALAALASASQEAATPSLEPPQPVPALPDTARLVSGRAYQLEDNRQGLERVALTFDEDGEAGLRIGTEEGDEVSWAIGLDQVPRRRGGWYGLPAEATGSWEADDVFVIRIDHIGLIDKEDVRVTFADDRITLEGTWLTLHGQLE